MVFKNRNQIIISALYFINVFAVNFPILGNASYWSVPIITLLAILISKSRTQILELTTHKEFYIPVALLLIILISSTIYPLAHLTYDFSVIKTWANGLLAYLTFSLLACWFASCNSSFSDTSRFITQLFIAQSFFVWLMLLWPDARELIQLFTKSSAALDRMSTYGGVRGLGLTSFAAFSFSVIMAIMAIVFCYHMSYHSRRNIFIKTSLFYITLTASISAGRTAVIGFMLGSLFFIKWKGPLRTTVTRCLRFLFTSVILATPLALYIYINPFLSDIVYTYSRYAFQFAYNYYESGSASYSSLESLSKMYFPLSELQTLWGDGRYTEANGSYYMHTDAGFMRFTLLYGVPFSLIIYITFIFYLTYIVRHLRFNEPETNLILLIALMTFIIHYKGEIIWFNIGYMKNLYFILLTLFLFYEKRKQSTHFYYNGNV